MDKQVILKRLAFIKYLFTQANNQSSLPEPLNAHSLLIFHDAIELFLHLSAEKLNISARELNDINFLAYWPTLKDKLIESGKKELTQEASMKRLNKARVSLKHHGNFPATSDINDFRIISNLFFEENCKNIFDIEVKDISLVEFVICPKAKEYLLESKNNFDESKLPECIERLVLSFESLIQDYEKTKAGSFYFGADDFTVNPDDSLDDMRNAVKILCLGIDYRKYVKFYMLISELRRFTNKQEPKAIISSDAQISKEFEYCFNFIIESALKLQEFDFAISY